LFQRKQKLRRLLPEILEGLQHRQSDSEAVLGSKSERMGYTAQRRKHWGAKTLTNDAAWSFLNLKAMTKGQWSLGTCSFGDRGASGLNL
jgi:hypothetical protein